MKFKPKKIISTDDNEYKTWSPKWPPFSPGLNVLKTLSDVVSQVGESGIAKLSQPLEIQWRYNERDGVSNHQPHDCLPNRLFKAQIKENIKAPRHWPLWGEFTGDRWIPRTKGQ